MYRKENYVNLDTELLTSDEINEAIFECIETEDEIGKLPIVRLLEQLEHVDTQFRHDAIRVQARILFNSLQQTHLPDSIIRKVGEYLVLTFYINYKNDTI